MAIFLTDEQIAALVPDNEKIIGQRYLCRCGHYHTHHKPVTVEDMIDKAAQKLAEEIDEDVVRQWEKMLQGF